MTQYVRKSPILDDHYNFRVYNNNSCQKSDLPQDQSSFHLSQIPDFKNGTCEEKESCCDEQKSEFLINVENQKFKAT